MVTLMETAKILIEEFCVTEYGEGNGADFSNMEGIPVAYTDYCGSNGELYEVQVNIDLVNCRLIKLVNGSLVNAREYDNLEAFIKADLSCLEFDELVDVSDWADKFDIKFI
jgi:hypothetical protein